MKANAYGHGLEEVITILEGKVDYFQVDDIEELRTLRRVSDMPCLVLGYILLEQLEEAVSLNGIVGVFEFPQLEKLNEIGTQQHKIVTVHLEIDALLGRLGILPGEVKQLLEKVKKFPHINIEALYGHFSDIEDSQNLEHAERQYEIVNGIAEKTGLPYHIAATSGMLADNINHWQGSIVRLGIGLYGIWPSERLQKQWQGTFELKPVLAWKSHIAQVKTLPKDYPVGYGRSYVTAAETKIAIIPQGYSDGYDRLFSNNGTVLVQGMRCPVIGRIAMNMFVIDVTAIKEVVSEEEVVLIGKQGDEVVNAEELAGKVGTINYEILARISPLLKRIIC